MEAMPAGGAISSLVPIQSIARSLTRSIERLIELPIRRRSGRARTWLHASVADCGPFRVGGDEDRRPVDQSDELAAPNGMHASSTDPRHARSRRAVTPRRLAMLGRRPPGSVVDVGVLKIGRDPRGSRSDVGLDDVVDPLGGLLRQAGRGDQLAFAELYDRLAPLVFGAVLKVVRDPSQSEEVAQEVFVELWRLAARYDGTKGSVTSWAATMAHRRAIDRVRSEQSARNRVAREASNLMPDHDDVVGQVETSFDQARVRRALEQLSLLQRESLELAYFGGHTYREVAVLLDVAEGTVKTRIRDGMIRLRDELGGTR